MCLLLAGTFNVCGPADMLLMSEMLAACESAVISCMCHIFVNALLRGAHQMNEQCTLDDCPDITGSHSSNVAI